MTDWAAMSKERWFHCLIFKWLSSSHSCAVWLKGVHDILQYFGSYRRGSTKFLGFLGGGGGAFDPNDAVGDIISHLPQYTQWLKIMGVAAQQLLECHMSLPPPTCTVGFHALYLLSKPSMSVTHKSQPTPWCRNAGDGVNLHISYGWVTS